jgi:hypothetical protein
MSSSDSSPEEAPSKMASSVTSPPTSAISMPAIEPSSPLAMKGEVENPDQPAVNQFDQVRRHLAVRLATRPLDEDVVDRSHLVELFDAQAVPFVAIR